jgi:ubiquinone/menaquinone biosynthesis C-methylase UbiE
VSQRQFWEGKKVLKRRSPSHPVIKAFALPKVKQILDVIKKEKEFNNLTLMDIGCGNGYFSFYLDRYFKVTCLDFSHNILSVCPLSRKIQGSALKLPVRDNSFSIAFCGNLLHHIQKPSLVIDEMIRVSSRYIVIIEPNVFNPLMLLMGLISKEDRTVINYTSRYLNSLVKGKAKTLYQGTDGFILPNKTPEKILPILKKVEPWFYPKLYHIVIAEKNNQ